MFDFENIIIGAGVIGLAVARDLANRGRAVLVIEKERSFGMGISSRNSEVIHAGIYYTPGSLKAKHCVEGRKLLYDYCDKKNIRNKSVGKLIVATSESDLNVLLDIKKRSLANGLVQSDRLELLSKSQVRSLEPELNCLGALYSPQTGIFDSHSYMQHLVWDAEKMGVNFAWETELEAIEYKNELIISGNSVGENFKVRAKNVVLAAGIHTAKISLEANLPTPSSYWLKGNYFSLRQKSPFKHLIYPVPSSGGLGTHLTLDLDGRAKFGPDTQQVKIEDYVVDPLRLSDFEKSIRKYWPALPNNSLSPAYAGIRPKLLISSKDEADFNIYTPLETKVDGLFVLHGIESPGLTASLSLASEIANQIEKAR